MLRQALRPSPPQQRRILIAVCVVALFYTLFESSRLFGGSNGDRKGAGSGSYNDEPSMGPAEVTNRTLGFQKIFVIGLPARTDRRDIMTLMSSVTDMSLDWIDGVNGSTVMPKVLPAGQRDNSTKFIANIGSWRAHMNVLRRIVEENISTALILEDDVDWDIRLKSQLQDFAMASQAYLQPQASSFGLGSRPSLMKQYTPPNMRLPPRQGAGALMDLAPLAQHSGLTPYVTVNLSLPFSAGHLSRSSLPRVVPPRSSPYGDGWDVLWLGHCGTELPAAQGPYYRHPTAPHPVQPQPLLRLALAPDHTVPQPAYLRPHPFANQDPVSSLYPPHTRLVHAAGEGTACTLGYAVSRRAAGRLLAQLGGGGWGRLEKGWDIALGEWCGGVGTDTDDAALAGGQSLADEAMREWEALNNITTPMADAPGQPPAWAPRRPPVCVAVEPPLVSHHLPTLRSEDGTGGGSDIQGVGGGMVGLDEAARTPYVRRSVRMNLRRLMGVGAEDDEDVRAQRVAKGLAPSLGWRDLVEQFPDSEGYPETETPPTPTDAAVA